MDVTSDQNHHGRWTEEVGERNIKKKRGKSFWNQNVEKGKSKGHPSDQEKREFQKRNQR